MGARASIFFLDSALTYEGVATTTISGLDHLEGEVVYGFANGVDVGPFTVSSGEITLSDATTKATIGLRYETIIKTFEPEILMEEGSSLGVNKNISEIRLGFVNTGGSIYVGRDEDNLRLINELLDNDTLIDILHTEEIPMQADGGWDDGTIIIKSSSSLPMNLTSIIYEIEMGE